jgi:hypothetical protein
MPNAEDMSATCTDTDLDAKLDIWFDSTSMARLTDSLCTDFQQFEAIVKVSTAAPPQRPAAAHVTFAYRVTAGGLSLGTRVLFLADLLQAQGPAESPNV